MSLLFLFRFFSGPPRPGAFWDLVFDVTYFPNEAANDKDNCCGRETSADSDIEVRLCQPVQLARSVVDKERKVEVEEKRHKL